LFSLIRTYYMFWKLKKDRERPRLKPRSGGPGDGPGNEKISND
jgi:hypothetical protein